MTDKKPKPPRVILCPKCREAFMSNEVHKCTLDNNK
jgi:hypothetical protein